MQSKSGRKKPIKWKKEKQEISLIMKNSEKSKRRL